jgi:hypothetical protein
LAEEIGADVYVQCNPETGEGIDDLFEAVGHLACCKLYVGLTRFQGNPTDILVRYTKASSQKAPDYMVL